MKVSRSTGYGLLAVGYVAQHREDVELILSQDIAKKYNIPLEYLLKILQQLVRANVLQSKRGPRGGFSLAKAPNKITMLQVIEAVEGPISGKLNIAKQARGDKFAPKAEQSYQKAIDQAKAVFTKIKIADLL